MLKKIIFVILASLLFVLLSGCSSNDSGSQLFTSKNPTITLEEQMTLYKNTDLKGPILGTALPGTYKVLDSEKSDEERGTWVKIEVNREKGWVYGVLLDK